MATNFYEIPKGSKSNSIDVFLQTATGGPLLGIGFNSAGLKAYFRRGNAVPLPIALVTQTAAGAWVSGGFCEIDQSNQPGMYRLDVPDAVSVPGVEKASIVLSGAPNMAPRAIGIPLNALVLSKHDGLARAGTLSTIQFAATAAPTDNLYKDDIVDIVAGTGAGQSRFIGSYVGATAIANVIPNFNVAPDITSVAVVRSFGLDSIKADDLVDLVWDELLASHVVPASFGARFGISHAGVAQGGSTINLTLAASSDTRDNFYKNHRLRAVAGAGAGQEAAISAYNGTSKVASFVEAAAAAFDATTVYFIVPQARDQLPQASIDAILDAPIAKPVTVPTSWTLRNSLGWLMGASIFKRLIAKVTGGGVITVRDDSDATDIATSQVTDDGTTTTVSEQTGP